MKFDKNSVVHKNRSLSVIHPKPELFLKLKVLYLIAAFVSNKVFCSVVFFFYLFLLDFLTDSESLWWWWCDRRDQ